MYRRPKFLEILDQVREQMSHEVDYDVDLFAEMVRQGNFKGKRQKVKGKSAENIELSINVFEDLSEINE
jgi:hypothetical protein